MLLAPYLVHRIAEVLGDVKPVERDALLRVRHVLFGDLNVRLPHVHRNQLHAL